MHEPTVRLVGSKGSGGQLSPPTGGPRAQFGRQAVKHFMQLGPDHIQIFIFTKLIGIVAGPKELT